MKIAIYSRKSVYREESESIKNQIDQCKKYFRGEHDFEIFEDEGFSGGNTDRPAFQLMMEKAKAKCFDIVAIYKVDRIARNIVDFVNIFDGLDKLNVKLVSVTEGFDPSTPIGKMMMMLLASFAEMERMNIAQRVKDNLVGLAKDGRWTGGTPPTGYKSVKVTENGRSAVYLKKVPEDEYKIKKIYEMYANGMTTYDISRELNMPNKTISNIMVNPVYCESDELSKKYLQLQGYEVYGELNGCGYMPYNRRPKKNGIKIKSSNLIVAVSRHVPIVSSDLWIEVQEKIKQQANEPKPRISQYTWLAHLVKCGDCKSGMIVSPGHKKKNGSYHLYFRCSGKMTGKNCDCKNIRVDDLEKNVLDQLKKFTLNRTLLSEDNSPKIENELKSLKKESIKNKKIVDGLMEKLALSEGDLTKLIIDKAKEMANKNKAIEGQIFNLERQQLLVNQRKANIDILICSINNLIERFDEMDIKDKQKYVRNIIKCVYWYSETGTVIVDPLL